MMGEATTIKGGSAIFREACRLSSLVYIINRFALDPKVHVYAWEESKEG